MKTRVLAILVLLVALPARGEVTFNHTLSIESDLRLVVDRDRGATPDQPLHFNWNRNAFEWKAETFIGDHVRGIASLRAVFFGIHKIERMSDLLDRRQADPYRIESDNAFLEISGLGLKGLNVKFGRMIHTWGTADNFSPTDLLNGRDFEDPLRFGGKTANQMAVATYYFPWLNMSLQGVWIPMFRPSMLPASSVLGQDDPYRAPVRDRTLKKGLIEEYEREKRQGATVFVPPEVRVNSPSVALKNMAGGVRFKIRPGGYDLSMSYFYGRHSFPVPVRAYAYSGNDVQTADGPRTEQRQFVDLIYPRFHAIGLDFAASLPWLFNLGVWLDMAVYHPERVDFLIYTTNYRPGDPCAATGAKGSDIRLVCTRMSDPWYFKMTAGVDYTFTSWLYANLQYLHGMDDEFGNESEINDYLAGGLDFKFFNSVLLLRFFTLWNMSDMSAVLFPQVVLTKWDSTEISVGGIFNQGDRDTKFGAKASGRNIVFTKVKYSF